LKAPSDPDQEAGYFVLEAARCVLEVGFSALEVGCSVSEEQPGPVLLDDSEVGYLIGLALVEATMALPRHR
jgi:hypothetical protein